MWPRAAASGLVGVVLGPSDARGRASGAGEGAPVPRRQYQVPGRAGSPVTVASPPPLARPLGRVGGEAAALGPSPVA